MTCKVRRYGVAFVAVVVLVGLLAESPIGGIFLRPVRTIFDSRYIATEVSPIPFDQARWQRGPGRHRNGMAQSLVAQKVLIGKSEAELIDLLGPPDRVTPGSDGTRWLLGYIAKGLFDESLWLEVDLDSDGRAASAGLGVDWYDPRDH